MKPTNKDGTVYFPNEKAEFVCQLKNIFPPPEKLIWLFDGRDIRNQNQKFNKFKITDLQQPRSGCINDNCIIKSQLIIYNVEKSMHNKTVKCVYPGLDMKKLSSVYFPKIEEAYQMKVLFKPELIKTDESESDSFSIFIDEKRNAWKNNGQIIQIKKPVGPVEFQCCLNDFGGFDHVSPHDFVKFQVTESEMDGQKFYDKNKGICYKTPYFLKKSNEIKTVRCSIKFEIDRKYGNIGTRETIEIGS